MTFDDGIHQGRSLYETTKRKLLESENSLELDFVELVSHLSDEPISVCVGFVKGFIADLEAFRQSTRDQD